MGLKPFPNPKTVPWDNPTKGLLWPAGGGWHPSRRDTLETPTTKPYTPNAKRNALHSEKKEATDLIERKLRLIQALDPERSCPDLWKKVSNGPHRAMLQAGPAGGIQGYLAHTNPPPS